MVTRPQQLEPAPLQLAWTPKINLEHPDAYNEVGSLLAVAVGRRVVVDVGRTAPWDDDIDWRIPDLLVHCARERNLRLELHGALQSITDWWRVLRDHDEKQRPQRHLSLVASR